MGAHLQLANPGAASVLAGTGFEPRVFSASFLERLAQLTHAERELRRLDLHVIWSCLAGPKPQAHIRRDATVSIAPLLNRMGPRCFREGEGYTLVSGEFDGVVVSWVETAIAAPVRFTAPADQVEAPKALIKSASEISSDSAKEML